MSDWPMNMNSPLPLSAKPRPVDSESQMKWKEDWPIAKQNFKRWWNGDGLVICPLAPRDEPLEPVPQPTIPETAIERWTNPKIRRQQAEYRMANSFFGAEMFPMFDTTLGPGSLGTLLGAEPVFEADTVWYHPSITAPESSPPLRLETENNRWWDVHVSLITEAVANADGRYLVSMPDLIENIDTLAALRGSQNVLFDLIERPVWVHEKLAEINQAFFAAFDEFYQLIKDDDNGNSFSSFLIWGPGRTAKVQCDLCCMISPTMFDEFIVPVLTEQCQWLDYAMFHLDGTDAVKHLDSILEIEALHAVEWTPQSGIPNGGDPCWYDLYRRIRAAGKSVQAVEMRAEQVVPLLDAVGGDGMFVMAYADTQQEAEELLVKTEQFR